MLVSRTNADQPKINLLGNALEALIGAIYLDKGYVRTKRYVIRKVLNKHVDIEKLAKKESDFKSRIIEWAQKNKQEINFVSITDSSDRSGMLHYTAKLILEEKEMGTGSGLSKKEAEQKAAEQALSNIDH
jgi:ribonuclease-3